MCEFPVNRLTTTEVGSCTTQFDLGVSSGLRSFTFFFPCKNERKNKNKKRHETSSSPGSTICVKKKKEDSFSFVSSLLDTIKDKHSPRQGPRESYAKKKKKRCRYIQTTSHVKPFEKKTFQRICKKKSVTPHFSMLTL